MVATSRLARLTDHLQTAETAVARALNSSLESLPTVPATAGGEQKKTRYAVVGLGGRSVMYSGAILLTYADRAELVGICDVNPARMDCERRLLPCCCCCSVLFQPAMHMCAGGARLITLHSATCRLPEPVEGSVRGRCCRHPHV